MFKFIVLSALVALAAAKPSYVHHEPSLIHHHHHEPIIHAAPIIHAPAVTKIVQPAPLVIKSEEHVGSVISSVPAGVSAYSHSVIHGHAAVVTPHIQPVHKTIISHHAPILTEPIISAHHHHHHEAPLLHAAPALSLAHSPLAYSHDSLAYGGGHLW